MGKFRILKNKDEALQCLMSLKVIFGMLDEHIIACFGAYELFFEGAGNPDLFLYLDEGDSAIVSATDNSVTVRYELEGKDVTGEIKFSEIEHYADMIADVLQHDINTIKN